MIGTALKLGRVSNLPTVWTNAMAGALLALSAAPGAALLPILLSALALTLFYVGGMWLNDAFDAEIDRAQKADRPIPMGEISQRTVFLGGFAMLGLGMLLTLPLGGLAVVAALLLTLSIFLYDWLHKRTALAPVIMGVTRFMCYALAAFAATGAFPGVAVWGALGLMAYVVGLTYAAKQEAYDRLERIWPLAVLAFPAVMVLVIGWGSPLALLIALGFLVATGLALRFLFRRAKGDVPRAVTLLIASISLYDAALIAGVHGGWLPALLAVAGFALTRVLQRRIAGT
ncbi:UbiA family prenyltransferase [Salipiger mangrovisoli]|uniref:UbiA family prenyltransferase n=1 Tax=Salipiger mangrovisoli TaxID=2865933 RepID=A0ABR9X7U6_9RHOB|nr:UbiA family prenyltransferase [Salipiger mangrovisoli]MBE9639669.1 UbiA family prenyltransferase [Salipiger mangrovisoli]